jgi:hypothetical protein
MIISTIIHGLELATVLLVGLMSLQITRCYRQYVSDVGKLAVQTLDTDQSVHRESVAVALSSTSEGAEVEVEVEAPRVEASPASAAILNDYIGGFFAAEPQADLNAFKAEAAVAVDIDAPVDAEVTVSKEQLAEFKAPETIEPILINPVRVIEVDEEDTFIVVEAESVEADEKKAGVMSDKVVHAMLEEANLVFTP